MSLLRRLLGLTAGTPSAGGPVSRIGAGLHVKGEVRGEGRLEIFGHFEGDIVLNGTVHVGHGGRVDANVNATAISVAGVLRGNLSADTQVEILPTGALTGTARSGSFAAADGATVKGEIWIEPAPAAEESRP